MSEKKVSSETKTLLEDFIRVYENNPCMWQVKSKDYHDKGKRDAAYDMLLQQYKLIDANADKNAVVKKINALRTNYRREKKKVNNSRHSGAGTDELYEPSLWYYHLFEFLNDQEIPRKSSSNLEIEEEDVNELTENSAEVLEESVEEQEPSGSSHLEQDACSKKTPSARSSKRSKEKLYCVLDSIEDHFKRPKLKEDRHDIFGKNVAVKMRDLSNNCNIQKLLAEKIINDALFMAEMGQLTLSHSIRGPTESAPKGVPLPQDAPNILSATYYQDLYPVSSENSNQSLSSYVTHFSDTS